MRCQDKSSIESRKLGAPLRSNFALRCGRLQYRPRAGLQDFDSIQVQCAVSNDSEMANRVSVTRRLELYFNLRSHGKICDCEKAHSTAADIHADSLQVSRAREDLDGTVPPLTRRTARNGLAAEEHARMGARLTCATSETKITKGHRRKGLRRAVHILWMYWRVRNQGLHPELQSVPLLGDTPEVR